jgi:hypothetical protein
LTMVDNIDRVAPTLNEAQDERIWSGRCLKYPHVDDMSAAFKAEAVEEDDGSTNDRGQADIASEHFVRQRKDERMLITYRDKMKKMHANDGRVKLG